MILLTDYLSLQAVLRLKCSDAVGFLSVAADFLYVYAIAREVL
jgi:hypothetical protein